MTNKNKLIQIRVNEEEKDAIEKQMRRENFSSLSEYIRKVCLDRVNVGEISK